MSADNDPLEPYKKFFYWTEDEVACYNKAIDDAAIAVTRMIQWMHHEEQDEIIDKIKSLKKNQP